ncbi:MAG: type II CRISPR RNA-guided endonuclease Cas9 [Alphaproteobacteria bacterium]
MAYRIGLDMGSNSLGWCIVDLGGKGKPVGVRDLGVRIYPDGRDPKSKASLAVDRRVARSMRRRRDRYLLRRSDLMAALVEHGLMPEDEAGRKKLEKLDPYEIRAGALDEAVPLHHLGRALFHLHQRRGFKSNRKTDKADDKEAGKIDSASRRLKDMIAGESARTLGEFLAARHAKRKEVRARLKGEGAKSEYTFYPTRDLVEAEFDALWIAQAKHHPELTEVARAEIGNIFFRQRPLKPVEPGRCTFEPDEQRLPRALPMVQRLRIHQELGNMKVILPGLDERPLTLAERDTLAGELLAKGKITFKSMRRKIGLDSAHRFSLEGPKRDHLKGDATALVLAHKDRFGKDWRGLAPERQSEIVDKLLSVEDETALIDWLSASCGLTADGAQAVSRAGLPAGYSRLGRTATQKILAALEAGSAEAVDPETGEVFPAPLTYDKAVAAAGWDHSDFRPDELLDRLPYYGEVLQRHVVGTGKLDDPIETRHGRIANPTVHVGLNQLRKTLNAVIEAYGPPQQIVVELARELKIGPEREREIEQEQAKNQKKNDARRADLAAMGLADNGENRMRLRLYEELDALGRVCVYCGKPIGKASLFDGTVAIDHILPFSRTLDNSAANRIVCHRECNNRKTNDSPFEAFGHTGAWEDILARSLALPDNKRWRFGPEAMERFDKDNGFLDRQLVDTAYLARIAKTYLGHICDANRVYVVPGRLTAMLRGKWGLNSLLPDHNYAATGNRKNRKDHRHHAIDAFVAAVTTRGTLQAVATAARRAEEKQLGRLLDDLADPFEGFRGQLAGALERTVVSHKPEHGIQGQLHEDTAYGIVADPGAEGGFNLVYRKALIGLNENEMERIRDLNLRERLRDHVHQAKGAGLALKEALAAFAEETGTHRVRLLKKEADVVAIAGPGGKPYKALIPGGNHHIDVYEQPDGTWVCETVSVFEANQDGQPARKTAHPAARRVMRLHKGDLLKLSPKPGEPEKIMRILRLSPSNNVLYLVEHNETGELQKRHDDPDDPFRWLFFNMSRLEQAGARVISVDILGKVRDPGPPK